MSYSQFFFIIGIFIALLVIGDRLASIWMKDDEDRESIRKWQENRKTLGRHTAREHDAYWNPGQTFLTGATNAGARRPTRTLRGDISRVSAFFKRTIGTRFSPTSTRRTSSGSAHRATKKKTH